MPIPRHGAPVPPRGALENVDFLVIKTHLSPGFGTHDNRTLTPTQDQQFRDQPQDVGE
jgi:hypothetical protein